MTPKRTLQKARAKRGRRPLLSYNQVTLRLPKRDRATGPSLHKGAPGKRYHERSGHLKFPARGDGKRLPVWVESYWAGDKSLGLVLKTRHVKGR
jgi:ribosomal protein L21E